MNEIATTAPPLADSEASSTTSLLNFVALAVKDKDIDVAKLDALLRMQREIAADHAKIEFAHAMARVQAAMPRVKKNGRVELGGGKGYDFARWEDMDCVLRPILEREGLSLSFDTAERQGGGAVISATVEHIGGHSRQVSIPLALDSGAGRNNLQAMGSTLSYGRRYCAEMLFNIVREGDDDDGVAAGAPGQDLLTAEQKQKISTLLIETRAELNAFLEYVGSTCGAEIGSIDTMQQRHFDTAMNALLSKKRRMHGAKP